MSVASDCLYQTLDLIGVVTPQKFHVHFSTASLGLISELSHFSFISNSTAIKIYVGVSLLSSMATSQRNRTDIRRFRL